MNILTKLKTSVGKNGNMQPAIIATPFSTEITMRVSNNQNAMKTRGYLGIKSNKPERFNCPKFIRIAKTDNIATDLH
jgi:hypothetical protein